MVLSDLPSAIDLVALPRALLDQLSGSHSSPLKATSSIIYGLLFLITCYAGYASRFITRTGRQRHLPGVPIVGGSDPASIAKSRERFVHDGKNMLTEGYKNNKNGFFYIPSRLGERLMMPARYLEDLKSAPIDKVDFVATFQEMFEGKYTTMGSRSTLHPRVVKAQLNQHLGMKVERVC